MDSLGIGDFRRADNGGDVQVALRRRRRANANRFIGQLYILGLGVRFGMHHNGFNAQFAAGALDTESDLATIGDQDFFKHSNAPNLGLASKGECAQR